ncbi:MAG: hypothetical protein AABX85_04655, partial [Nanoarchaeota archaeon]
SSGVAAKSTTFSLAVTAISETIPNAPSNLVGAGSSNQVQLTWTDNSNNEQGFRVYRNGSLIATVTGNSYSDNTVVAGAIYNYYVTAYNAAGESAASNIVNVIMGGGQQLPTAPTSLSATAYGPYNISLQWQDNSDNENGFKIMRTDNLRRSPFVVIASVGSSAGIGSMVQYKDEQLSSGTTYYYKVYAFNSFGDSSTSLVASAKTYRCSWWKKTFYRC